MERRPYDSGSEEEGSYVLPHKVFGAEKDVYSALPSFDPETHAVPEESGTAKEDAFDASAYGEELGAISGAGTERNLLPAGSDDVEFDIGSGAEGEGDEFPDTLIDKDEMVETSDDQDILGSPHSSFSYDDTLSEHEIDGLTNYNIILEYPQLTFENVQLLPFVDELNDWFSHKDLKHLKTISQIAANISVADLPTIRENLRNFFDGGNLKDDSYGKVLESLLHLAYIAMGCFNNASSQLDIKNHIFENVVHIIKCEGLVPIVIDIVLYNAIQLTDCGNLEFKVSFIKQKLLSSQFFFALTVLYIVVLSFNSEELNEYDEKRALSDIFAEKNIMVGILKAIDRWKWISSNCENDDPTLVVESMNSKANDSEKRQVLVVTQFKIRNVLSLFNNLIIFQFGDLNQIESTKDFLKYKFETSRAKDECSDNKDQAKNVNTASSVDAKKKEDVGSAVKSENEVDDMSYTISSLDYEYYINELMSRYPTYSPPKYEISEILEMMIKNEGRDRISDLINVDSLLINQHQHLKNSKHNMAGFGNEPPDVHIATPMPSPTLTPQHTGNTRNYSNISEFEHTSNEIKKKLYITQSNFPNIYPSDDSVPASIRHATNIFFHHIKDNANTQQFVSTFEEFINKENGYASKKKDKPANYIYTKKDINENPMFEDEIRSLINVENFYKQGIPYFNSLIFIILKLLISNTIPTQQSSESGKTRQRTPYVSKSSEDDKPYLSEKLSTFGKQKLEINRMKETMLKASSSILLMLQKWFKLSHVLKFEFFTTLLFDQEFLIYLFRYLDSNKIQAHAGKDFDIKETKSLINNRIVYCDYNVLYYLEDYNFFFKCLALSKNPNKEFEKVDELADFNSIFENVESSEAMNPLSFILPFVPHNRVFTIVNPNQRCCILMANLLQSMYYTISRFKIQRIYKLIGVRPTEILRFYLTLHNKLFYLPILKTIKLLSPFIGKKWRANNMDLISFVYLFHKIGLKDPWLNNFFNVGIEENTKRGFDNEVSLRSMIKFYNYEYYGDELSKHGFSRDCVEFMDEVEKLNGDFFAKECFDLGV
ncbi:hypothetical protein PMKS-001302 [Pichia membranifaciens]|uniref:Factor arrest protein 11 n=1 Tax=Pichia membranifaciens TaxID=4926 RepID=A0A1Q2YE90_9ASCO|nr:hypothetical protein PMKS-001302 [Pichia membranifaciens]